jgi:hypothetical protein
VIGGGILIESSGDGGGLTSDGWHFNGLVFNLCAYGIMFLGHNSIDSEVHDVHTDSCILPIILGLSTSDNAGGVLISDCHSLRRRYWRHHGLVGLERS